RAICSSKNSHYPTHPARHTTSCRAGYIISLHHHFQAKIAASDYEIIVKITLNSTLYLPAF
ncbi:MAG: hypothetical protein ACI4UL_04865, partial [Muribaculaceae bacterium]